MRGSLFPTTRRSVVLALASDDAADRSRAFDALVAIYWKPLYKYVRIAHHRVANDAEDLTQAFLTRAFDLTGADSLHAFWNGKNADGTPGDSHTFTLTRAK